MHLYHLYQRDIIGLQLLDTFSPHYISVSLLQQAPTPRMLGHPLVSDHMVSRSYLPSAAGQAAYYQAETCGGLAVCQPLTRISNHHHFQGESPAEEVIRYFEKVLKENFILK